MSNRALARTMVGRRRQLAELAEHLELARAGSGRLVFVAGEAGVGKTRLLREFARAHGLTPATGSCFDERPAPPYGPFIELLRSIALAPGAPLSSGPAGPWAGDLGRLLPDLALEAPLEPTQWPQTERRRIFQAIYQAIRPSHGELRVLIIEDLHWADEVSQDLLHVLAREIEGEPLLMICTYRSDEIHRMHPLAGLIARLTRDRRYHEVQVAPLPPEDLAELLAAIIGAPPAPELLADLYERTEGNPFFAEEILESLIAHGGPGSLAAVGRGQRSIAIPLSIKDSILRRVAELDGPTASALRAAAVVGRRFGFELLLRLTAMDERALLRSLSTLVERQLIAEVSGESGDTYHFRHELIRAALYEEMLRRERRLRHLEVLRALEALRSSDDGVAIDQLAYHAIQARAAPQAARYSELAGDRAAAIHAYRAALGHYENALEVGENGDGDAPWRAGLLVRIGHAAFLVGDLARASGYWHEALALYQKIGATRQSADIQRMLGRAAWDLGDREKAFIYAHAALATLEGAGPCRELAMAYSTLSHLSMLLMFEEPQRATAAIAWGEQALAMARQLDDQPVICHALNNIGVAMSNSGQVDAGIARLKQSLAIALDADLPADALRAYINLAGQLGWAGKQEESLTLLREGWGYAARHSYIRGSGKLFRVLNYHLLQIGRWAEAKSLIDDALRPSISGLLDEPNTPLALRAILLWLCGHLDAARDLIERLRAQTEGDLDEQSEMDGLLALTYRAQGDHARAEALADQMVAQIRAMAGVATDSFALGRRALRLTAPAEIYLDTGRRDDAIALIQAMEAAVASRPDAHGEALLAEMHGIAKLMSQPLAAAAHFAEAASIWKRDAYLLDQVRLGRRRAQALLQAGGAAERAQALALIAEARITAEQIGYGYELAKLAAIEPATAPVRAPTPQRPPDGLTPREMEVLALITRGLSNRAIAEALVISEKTAEVHVRNILAKLGFSSRTQAAAYAVERGLARTA